MADLAALVKNLQKFNIFDLFFAKLSIIAILSELQSATFNTFINGVAMNP